MEDNKAYHIIDILVHNSLEEIMRVQLDKDGEHVIVKAVDEAYASNDEIVNEFNNIKRINNTGCTHFIKAREIFNYGNEKFLILQNVKGISLRKYIDSNGVKNKNILEKIDIAIDLVKALEHFHSTAMLHNNLAPEHILVDKNTSKVTIVDMSLATPVTVDGVNPEEINIFAEYAKYISPERTGRTRYMVDQRSDLYSLGLILYELFFEKYPYKIENMDLMSILNNHITAVPEHLNNSLFNSQFMINRIIAKLLEKDLTNRYQSAHGIGEDLLFCKSYIEQHQNVPEFPLGRKDFFGIIQFSNRLYGKEDALNNMRKWYAAAGVERNGICFVSGFSGVGKTALVHKFFDNIVGKDRIFIKGKFEVSKINIPYLAFRQLFSDLINKVANKMGISHTELLEKLTTQLGKQAWALVPVIPDVRLLIHEKDCEEVIDPKTSEMIMYNALEKLLDKITLVTSEIIFFIDDLQWADYSSIEMAGKLIEMKIPGIYFLVNYRSNEIQDNLFLTKKIKDWKEILSSTSIHLESLKIGEINEFISDSLSMSCDETKKLSEIIYRKTQGNIFFTKQFLMLLNEKKLLSVELDNCERYKWKWNTESIINEYPTENVIQIISKQLETLDKDYITVLTYAACLGNVFDLEILDQVIETNKTQLRFIMYHLGQKGIIEINGNRGAFVHDRIHQAVYNMIDPMEIKKYHFIIGKKLHDIFLNEERNINIFDIVFHWNLAKNLLTQEKEKFAFAALSLQAAKKAKDNSAYSEFLAILKNGSKFVHTDMWNKAYNFIMKYTCEMAEALFLNGEHEEALKLAEICAAQALSLQDQFKPNFLKLKIKMAESKLEEVISIGWEYLNLMGLNSEINLTPQYIANYMKKIVEELGEDSAKTIRTLGVMKNIDSIHAMKILTYMVTPAYMISPLVFTEIILNMCELSIKYGNTVESPYAWALMGFTCINMNLGLDVTFTNKVADEAMRLRHAFGNKEFRTTVVYYELVEHRLKPMGKNLDTFMINYRECLQVGDIEYACQSLLQYIDFAFNSGYNLTKLLEESSEMLSIVQKNKQQTIYNRLSIDMQLFENFIIPLDEEVKLKGNYFDEDKALPIFKEIRDTAAIFIWASQKLFLSAIIGNYEEADKIRPIVEEYKAVTPGRPFEINYHFYLTLSRLRRTNSSDPKEIENTLSSVAYSINIIETWGKSGPNYIFKAKLIQAEISRINRDYLKALSLYNQAVESALKNNFIHEAALGYELMGLMNIDLENIISAEMFLRKSYELYEKWSAATKLEQMKENYKCFLKHKSNQMNVIKKDMNIDLQSILNASSTLSETVDFNALINKMMKIVLLNSCATKVIFIEGDNGKITLQDIYAIEKKSNETILYRIQYNEKNKSKELPITAIEQSIDKHDIIVVEHPYEDDSLSKDVYILRNKPKVILSIPLYKSSCLIGVLYLENNIFSSAFTTETIEVLKMLSSQIAISIENSKLYLNLEEQVRSRTEELQKALEKVEKLASYDKLTNIYNRMKFDEIIDNEVDRLNRYEGTLSIIIADIDHFKRINDTYGHIRGDEALKTLAQIIKEYFRKTDVIARWGGEEFIILLPETNSEIAFNLAEKLRKIVENNNRFSINEISLSLGVEEFKRGDTKEKLIERADKALYLAKGEGRNRTMRFSDFLASKLKKN